MVKGVGGGNFLMLARSADAALEAAEAAVDAMAGMTGVILPFPGGVVRSGSKVGSRRIKSMIASTNDAFCPTLRAITDTPAPGRRELGARDRHQRHRRGGDRPGDAGGHRRGLPRRHGRHHRRQLRRQARVRTTSTCARSWARPRRERRDRRQPAGPASAAAPTSARCWREAGAVSRPRSWPGGRCCWTASSRCRSAICSRSAARRRACIRFEGDLRARRPARRRVWRRAPSIVESGVGDEAGLGMSGGVLDVRGDAGDRTGGAAPDARKGHDRRRALVRGSAGAEAGDRMRRGLLVVTGDVAARAGPAMIAGHGAGVRQRRDGRRGSGPSGAPSWRWGRSRCRRPIATPAPTSRTTFGSRCSGSAPRYGLTAEEASASAASIAVTAATWATWGGERFWHGRRNDRPGDERAGHRSWRTPWWRRRTCCGCGRRRSATAPGSSTRASRWKAATGPGSRSPRSAWAGWATSASAPRHDRRASPGRRSWSPPTIPRSPAWRRSTPAGRSRWTSSSRWDRGRSGRTPGWRRSCSRSWATRRRRPPACWCSRAGPLPTEAVAAWVAEKAGLKPSQLTFVIAPTASLAGGVQISARILETGLHKMETLGFDVRRVVSGYGTAPHPAGRQERPPRHRPHQRLHPLRRSGPVHRARRRRRAGGAGRQGAGLRVARLRDAVLRHLPALRRRLLQDRSPALQPGRGLADQHRDRAHLSRRAASIPRSSRRACIRSRSSLTIRQEPFHAASPELVAGHLARAGRGVRHRRTRRRRPRPTRRGGGGAGRSGRSGGHRDRHLQPRRRTPPRSRSTIGETHLPLVSANQQEIGFTRADLTKFTGNLDGKKPTYYRQAELYFPSLDAAKKGMATPGLQEGGATTSPTSPAAGSPRWSRWRPATGDRGLDRGADGDRHGDLQAAQGHRGVREVLRRDPRAAGGRQPGGDRVHQGGADQVRLQPRRLRRRRSTARPSCTSPRWTRSRRAPRPRASRRWRTIWRTSRPAGSTGWSRWRRSSACTSSSSPPVRAGTPGS